MADWRARAANVAAWGEQGEHAHLRRLLEIGDRDDCGVATAVPRPWQQRARRRVACVRVNCGRGKSLETGKACRAEGYHDGGHRRRRRGPEGRRGGEATCAGMRRARMHAGAPDRWERGKPGSQSKRWGSLEQ